MSLDQDPEARELPFAELLNALKDETQAFPARYLYRLSGLEEKELGLLRQTWTQLSAQRRLGLLEDLELLAESNTVMHFDAIQRLALGDAEPNVRIIAMRSLWQSEQADLVPTFIQILEWDEDAEVRAQAAATLGHFVYLGELGKIPPGTMKEIEQVLFALERADIDLIIRQRALESLGYSSHPDVPELIESAYESGEEDWIVSALFAMGRSADDRWAPLVIESLQDPSPAISQEAAKAAGELELGEARPALFDLLQAEDSDVRLAAAWALSQMGGQDAAEALDELLGRTEDEDEIDLIENAIENLAFTEELGELNLLDFAPEDLGDLAKPDNQEGDDYLDSA